MQLTNTKRRYSVSLTPANVDRFQSLLKRLKLPPSTMSAVIDDNIRSMCGTFQTALDKGTKGITDLFKEQQQEFELLQTEDKKEKSNVSGTRQKSKHESKTGAKP
jgi:hypothetical protein